MSISGNEELLSADEQKEIESKVFALFASAAAGRALPDVLFHYTDSGGLKGIIESGSLRATHLAYLNDASEYLHAVQVLLEKVTQARGSGSSDLQLKLLSEMEPILAATRPENVNPYFVTCFSEEPNSLNQWRAYGRGEGAFSIGFDGRQMYAMALKAGALLSPVIYERAAQAKLVQDLLDWALKEYPTRAKARPADRHDLHRGRWVEHFFKVASNVAPVMKNPSFSEEREWRLIRPMGALGEVQFLPKERGLSPYVSLHLGTPQQNANPRNPSHVNPLPDRLPITVVWTGPGQMKEVSRVALQALLHQCNYGVRLETSDIPYRVT